MTVLPTIIKTDPLKEDEVSDINIEVDNDLIEEQFENMYEAVRQMVDLQIGQSNSIGR